MAEKQNLILMNTLKQLHFFGGKSNIISLIIFVFLSALFLISTASFFQEPMVEHQEKELLQIAQDSLPSNNQLSWFSLMLNPKVSFFDVVQAYQEQTVGLTPEEIGGFDKFWQYYGNMVNNVNAEGFVDKEIQFEKTKAIKANQNKSGMGVTGNWTVLGPINIPSPDLRSGHGRIDYIAFHPTDANTFYISTPCGGVWKTTDDAASWTVLTDDWDFLGASQIVIDHTNHNTLYVGSGDYLSWYSLNQSLGIRRSLDAGSTWGDIGLSSASKISRMVQHPTDNNIMYAATDVGLFKTINLQAASPTWTELLPSASGERYLDFEFKPGTPTTLYAGNLNAAGEVHFFKSIDSGANWTESVMPFTFNSNLTYVNIAVTADAPDNVFLIPDGVQTWDPEGTHAGLNFDEFGVCRSTDSGANFSLFSDLNTPVYHANGSLLRSTIGGSGYGSWCFKINVSPYDQNEIYIAGVWMYKTTDNGQTWTMITDGNIHVDNHSIEWHPITQRLYNCNDGSVYREPIGGQTQWDRLGDGMSIHMNYRMSNAPDGNGCASAGQDNGTFYYHDGAWTWTLGGDGIANAIDPGNPNISYQSFQGGNIARIEKNGSTSSKNFIQPTEPQTWPFWTELELHPFYRERVAIYGENDLYISNDKGNTWSNVTNGNAGSGTKAQIKFAKSNPDFIYLFSPFYRSEDAGSTWTPGATPPGGVGEFVVDPTDPLHLLVAGNGVWESTDGAASWTDISGNLSGVGLGAIDYQPDNDGLYVGGFTGIWYKDNTLANWITFDTGLPPGAWHSVINILPEVGKVRTATLGRGVWESDLYAYNVGAICAPIDPPTISVNICSGATLTANSAPSGYGYQWYTDDGAIVGATSQSYTPGASGRYYVLHKNNSTDCHSYLSYGTEMNLANITTLPDDLSGGEGVSLDGTDDYISIPNGSQLTLGNDFTWEFWLKTSDNASLEYLIRKDGAYGIDVVNGNDLSFVTWGDDINFTNGLLNDGEWHHYAFVASGGNSKKLYHDGVLFETNISAYTTNTSGSPLHIGFTTTPFDFSMDDFRVWNDARTEQEIINGMYCKPDCQDASLVAYFPFEDGVASGDNSSLTSTLDYSSYGNNGTLNNFTLTGAASNFIAAVKSPKVSGPVAACPGGATVYSVPSFTNTTGNFSWTLPSGWTGSSTSNTISVTPNSNSGTLSVDVPLDCGATITHSISASVLTESLLIGEGLNLVEGNDNASIPHATQLNLSNDFTWEFWANSTDNSGYEYILRKSGAYGIDIQNGTNLLFVTWGDDVFFNGGFLNDGNWHHYAFVASGGTTKTLYRDGIFIETITSSYTTDQSTNPLYIGFTSSTYGFSIDELRIWNDARTQQEIIDNLYCVATCGDASLVAYFPLDDGTPSGDNSSITSIQDYSNYKNHATLNNFTLSGSTSNFVSSTKTPAVIGNLQACQGTGFTYSVPNFSNVSGNYTWTLPSGWTGSSTTNSIVATPSATAGTISVSAPLDCGAVNHSLAVTILDFSSIPANSNQGDGIAISGGTDYVEVPHADNLNPSNNFTIEFWAKASTSDNQGFFLRKAGSYEIELFNTTDIKFGTHLDDAIFTNGFLNDGDWHHYALVASGGNFRVLYRDGSSIGTNNTSFTPDISSNPLKIGNDEFPIDFSIDEVRFWSDARSAAEVLQDMTCSHQNCEDNLEAYFPFEEGAAGGNNTALTTTNDYSSNANHGTLTNMTLTGTASNFIDAGKGTPNCSGIVPIEWISFSATAKEERVLLEWKVATEIEVEGYEVQRSRDSKNWEHLDFVAGAGNSTETLTYNYEDQNPLRGANYYRLKQMDFDGSFSYSVIRTVNFGDLEEIPVQVFPVPTRDILFINTPLEGFEDAKLYINDLNGRTLWTGKASSTSTENTWQLDVSNFSKGVYFLQIKLGGGAALVKKFVLE